MCRRLPGIGGGVTARTSWVLGHKGGIKREESSGKGISLTDGYREGKDTYVSIVLFN